MLSAKHFIPGLGTRFQIKSDELDVDPGALARSVLTTDSLAAQGVPLTSIKNADGSTIAAGAGGASGKFTVNVSSHVEDLIGQVATSATITSSGAYQFRLPVGYVAGGLISVQITTKLLSGGVSPTNNGSDLTVSAYVQALGAVGSNLGPVAQTYAAIDTWYTKTFVITPTARVAGEVINLEIVARAIESMGGNLQSVIGEVAVLCDVKG